MPEAIKIRIGASLDSSVSRSFQTAEAQATRAAQNSARAARRANQETSTSVEREYRRQLVALNRVAAAQDRLYTRNAAAAARAAAAGTRAQERAASVESRARQRAADIAAAAQARKERVILASEARIAAAQVRGIKAASAAEDRASARTRSRFATAMGYTTQRTLIPYRPLASLALRTAGDITRGAGVDLSAGASVARNVALQTAATDLANKAFIEGAPGQAGIRQDPNALIKETRSAGQAVGLSPAQAMEGLDKFANVSGDLATGRAVLVDMGKLAAISGAGWGDVVDAAGQVNAVLAETPDKANRIVDVMRAMVGQGKLGAVELKEQAVQMAKLAATAGRIEGDPATNIKRLGALMQLARQRGGAAHGAQAATSIARLADMLVTPARAKAFDKAGIKTTTADGMIRDPTKAIFEALEKFGKMPIKMRNLFASSIGARPMEALSNISKTMGGGEGGLQGAKDKFDEFANATISDKAAADSLAAHLDTTAAKATNFNAAFDTVIDEVQRELLPSMEKLGPAVLTIATGLGKLATWAAENPGQAILTGILASIAQAGIGTAIRIGVERAIEGRPPGAPGAGGGKRGSPGGGFWGGGTGANIAAGLNIAGIAITTAQIGKAFISEFFTNKDKEDKGRVEKDVGNINTLNQAQALARAGKTEEAKALLNKFMQANQEGMSSAPDGKTTKTDIAAHGASILVDQLTGKFGGEGHAEKDQQAAQSARHLTELKHLEGMKVAQQKAIELLAQLVAQGGATPPPAAGGITVYSPPTQVPQ